LVRFLRNNLKQEFSKRSQMLDLLHALHRQGIMRLNRPITWLLPGRMLEVTT